MISAEFSKETARSFIDSFEKYINDNKDSVEALRIIYNSENTAITYSMLCDLRDKLLSKTDFLHRRKFGTIINFSTLKVPFLLSTQEKR